MPTLARTELVPASRLCTFAAATLEAAGMVTDDAAIGAAALIWRDLRDAVPFGLPQLPQWLESIRTGATDPRARPQVPNRGIITAIDGQRAWGQLVATQAMRVSIAAAKTSGIGITFVRNTSTAGAMGYYPTLAVAEQLVGIALTNGTPLQPPWGGTTKVLGNQAYSYAVPAGRHHPLLYDGATTAMSRSGISRHLRSGTALPAGVALTDTGLPTVDPAAALAGMLLPSGGHRGYALSVLWEVLTGVLSRAPHFGADCGPMDTSLFLLAIDPSVVMPVDEFTARVDALVDQLHASPPAAGTERVFAPGERGFLQAAVRERDGIPLAPERVAALAALGAQWGVAW